MHHRLDGFFWRDANSLLSYLVTISNTFCTSLPPICTERDAYEHAQLGADTKSLFLQGSAIASLLWPDSYLPCALDSPYLRVGSEKLPGNNSVFKAIAALIQEIYKGQGALLPVSQGSENPKSYRAGWQVSCQFLLASLLPATEWLGRQKKKYLCLKKKEQAKLFAKATFVMEEEHN